MVVNIETTVSYSSVKDILFVKDAFDRNDILFC